MKLISSRIFSKASISPFVLWLFFFFLPTQLGKHFFMNFSYVNGVRVDYLAPAIYFTDLLFFAVLALFWRQVYGFLIKCLKPALAILVLIAINIFISQEPLLALYSSAKFFQILILFIIFSDRHTKISTPLILSAISASAALQLSLAIAQFSLKHSLQGPFYYLGERFMTLSTPGIAKASLFGIEILRPYGTFSHPNSLGGFYLLVFAWLMSQKNKTPLTYIAMTLSTFLILISFSKTAIFVFLLLSIAALVFTKRKSVCLPCTTARFFVLLAVAIVFLQSHADPLSFQKRLLLFQQAADIFFHNPLFGVGMGQYVYAHAKYPQPYSFFFLQPVHNIFLLFMMQAGLAISIPVAFWLSRALRLVSPAILVVLLVTGMADHYWITLQQNMLLMGVILGINVRNLSSQP